MRKIIVFLFLLVLFYSSYSFGQTEGPDTVIDITGKVITSDDGDVPGRLEKVYFSDKKEYSKELISKDGFIWNIDYKQEISAGGKKYFFVVYKWTGNAAALIVYEDKKGKLLRIGGYANIFGGNGVDINIEKIVFGSKKIELVIKWTGYFHNPVNWEELGYSETASEEIKLIINND